MNQRITIVTGHYGSGKTEFSVNYALHLKKHHEKTALIDMDIANPYFRSRERQQFLQEQGIDVYSNTYGYDITADLPAITASVRAPLENPGTFAVVDAGGDDSGARVLNQFRKYFLKPNAELLCVINANRPETSDVKGAIHHIESIQNETGLIVQGLVNNTHLLRETRCHDILKGSLLCDEIFKATGIPVFFHCCEESLLLEMQNVLLERELTLTLFPIKLYMRPSWLDL